MYNPHCSIVPSFYGPCLSPVSNSQNTAETQTELPLGIDFSNTKLTPQCGPQITSKFAINSKSKKGIPMTLLPWGEEALGL